MHVLDRARRTWRTIRHRDRRRWRSDSRVHLETRPGPANLSESFAAAAQAALATVPDGLGAIGWAPWAGLFYVTAFSMLIGFVFWYRGLALGGIAGVGQLQLLQPFFGFLLAALLLGESVTWPMLAVTAAVVACVAGAKRFA